MNPVSEKPSWKTGDVLALTQGLAPDGSEIYHGCHVFTAERDPEFLNGAWRYCFRNASELRLATIEDIDRLIEIELKESRIEQASAEARIRKLNKLRIEVSWAIPQNDHT